MLEASDPAAFLLKVLDRHAAASGQGPVDSGRYPPYNAAAGSSGLSQARVCLTAGAIGPKQSRKATRPRPHRYNPLLHSIIPLLAVFLYPWSTCAAPATRRS